jgi:hypothetical protein
MTEQLEEGKLSNLAIAGAVAIGGAYGLLQKTNTTNGGDKVEPMLIREHPDRITAREEVKKLTNAVVSKYKHIPVEFAEHVASMAKKHEHAEFPKAKDIMAIVGIESSFNPDAKSKLKIDPARGLMQQRPRIWGLNHKTDLATPEQQIQKGAEILATYHKKFGGDADKAVHGYNIGETNLRKGQGLNPGYVEKFKKERQIYD